MSAAFRLFDPMQTFFDLEGKLAAGGVLNFYQAGTTTPADVYGDSALTTDNGNTVAIGTDGRPVDDIWGNISYRARLYDVLGTLVSDRDNIQIPGGTGLAIPALVDGDFLTNDGSVLAWSGVEQVPDPTGLSGKVLSNDGANLIWVDGTPPPAPVPPIVNGANSVKIGTTLIQWGTATAPASGSHTTGLSVTFPAAYTAAPFVSVSRGGIMCPSGFQGTMGAQAVTPSGFFAGFDTNVQSSDSAFNISSTVPFTWLAVGPVAA